MLKKKFKSARPAYKHTLEDVIEACRLNKDELAKVKECYGDINKVLFYDKNDEIRTSNQVEFLERVLEKYDLRIISLAMHTFFRRIVSESVMDMKLAAGGESVNGLADKLKALLGGIKGIGDDDKTPPTMH